MPGQTALGDFQKPDIACFALRVVLFCVSLLLLFACRCVYFTKKGVLASINRTQKVRTRSFVTRTRVYPDDAVLCFTSVWTIAFALLAFYSCHSNSLADSSLSFLYSVKLDAAVLSLNREASEEMEAQAAALEVADSVLDVRHAFFQVRLLAARRTVRLCSKRGPGPLGLS